MLVREEASTRRRNCNKTFVISLSVVKCDHEGCDEAICVGPGDGHSLSDEQIKDLSESGWSSDGGNKDYCPAHVSDAEFADADDGG